MSEPERSPDIDLSVEAKRARELLHRLEAPRPDSGFRARLKETFVGGGFVEERGEPAASPTAEPEDAPRRGGIGPIVDDAPGRGGIGPIADDELDRLPRRPRHPEPRAPRATPPPRPAA
ncbi:MAG TPA: hypothetical protein VFF34_02640, partial [Candidatus Nitrosocosmicus sp.]|nr:hypothetical protein [Candidatus Nitrosocosmicus sp.]